MSEPSQVVRALRCPRCDTPFAADALNALRGTVSCAKCREDLNLLVRAAQVRRSWTARRAGRGEDAAPASPPAATASSSSAPAQAEAGAASRLAPLLPLPAALAVSEEPGGLLLTWRWPAGRGLIYGIVAVVSLLFGLPFLRFPDVAVWVYVAACVALGGASGWVALAHLANTTRVTVSSRALRVSHRPIPWPGQGTLNADDLRQLYVVKTGRRSATDEATYALHVVLRNGRRRKLVGGLYDLHLALQLEQLIEKRLRIADRPVEGEVKQR